jgi:hypothetical protein
LAPTENQNVLFAAWALDTDPVNVTGAFAVVAALAGTVATIAPTPRVLTASIEGTTTFVKIFFMIILSLSVCVLLEYFESNLDCKGTHVSKITMTGGRAKGPTVKKRPRNFRSNDFDLCS